MAENYFASGGVDIIGGHGGGVGSLNTIYKTLAQELTRQGRKVILLNDGYHGLLKKNGEGFIDLSKHDLPADFFDAPGSSLGSPKGSPVAKEGEPGDRIDDVITALRELKAERVFFTCGNGGVKNNNRVFEKSGIDHVLIGKTPDGNFPYSYASGFSSTVSHDISEIQKIEAAARSSKLIYVVQQMDDGSGQPPFWAARYTNTNAVLAAPHAYEYNVEDVKSELTAPFKKSRGRFEGPPYAILLIGEKVPALDGSLRINTRLDGSTYPANMAEIFADNIQDITGIQSRGTNFKHTSRGALNDVDRRIARELAMHATQTRCGVVCLQHAHFFFDPNSGNLEVDGGEYRIELLAKVAHARDLGIELDKSYDAVRAKGIYAGVPKFQIAQAA